MLQQEVCDWVVEILKKRIVLAKFSDWSCKFFLQRCPELWIVMHTPLFLCPPPHPRPISMLKGLSHTGKMLEAEETKMELRAL